MNTSSGVNGPGGEGGHWGVSNERTPAANCRPHLSTYQNHHFEQNSTTVDTETLLPVYRKVIQDAQSAGRRAILQENHDPSHGTNGTGDNLAWRLKQKHGIELLKHPAQRPDVNPAEGGWNTGSLGWGSVNGAAYRSLKPSFSMSGKR